jgi:hypothetical protein
MTPKETAEVHKLCRDAAILKERFHRAGLHKTAHAMEAAVQAVGWEAAALFGDDPCNGERYQRSRGRAERRVRRAMD